MTHAHTLELNRRLTLGLAAGVFSLLFMPRASHAMTVAPPVLNFTLNPGDTVSDVVQVTNEEDAPFKITPQALNFYQKAGDETSGSPEFYPADQVKNGYELAPWIVLKSEAVIVAPHQLVNFPIDIKVPKDAQPGGHFGALQLLATDPNEKSDAGSVSIARGTSVLIFVRVSGDVREEMSVSRFGGDQGTYAHLPVDFHIRLDDTGNLHERPTGDIFIKDMFGRQVAAVPVNPGPEFKTVLPGTSRRFDDAWVRRKLPDDTSEYWQQVKNFGFGKYDATLVLNYGSDNKILTATWSFWVLPWLALASFLGIILVLSVLIGYGVHGYNRLIIRRYEAKKRKQNA